MSKRDVLEHMLDRGGAWTNPSIAAAFRRPEAQAGSVLRRLEREGLVERGYTADGRVARWVSVRGAQRVAYWRARDTEQDLIDDGPDEQEDEGQADAGQGGMQRRHAPERGASDLARLFPPRADMTPSWRSP